MRLLILSDLHIDAWPMSRDKFACDFDVVVLAGDIHKGVESVEWSRWAFPDKPVVLVAGNHEFYEGEWNSTLQEMRDKAQFLGIHFLENDSVEIDGIRFLGCSLWTDFMLHGEKHRSDSMLDAEENLNDYKLIQLDGESGNRFEPGHTIDRHQQSLSWLQDQLAMGEPAKTVVVTHHAPLGESIPTYYLGHKLSPAFASHLPHLMGRSKLWIHGHVHESVDIMEGGTRVVCNPRGYARHGRNENERFDPGFVVELQ